MENIPQNPPNPYFDNQPSPAPIHTNQNTKEGYTYNSVPASGLQNHNNHKNNKKPLRRRKWLWLIIILVVLVVLAAAIGGGVGGALAHRKSHTNTNNLNSTSTSSSASNSAATSAPSSTTSSRAVTVIGSGITVLVPTDQPTQTVDTKSSSAAISSTSPNSSSSSSSTESVPIPSSDYNSAFTALPSSSIIPAPTSAALRTLSFSGSDGLTSYYITYNHGTLMVTNTTDLPESQSNRTKFQIYFSEISDPSGYVYCETCSPSGMLHLYNGYLVIKNDLPGSNTFTFSRGKLDFWTREGVKQQWCVDENFALRPWPQGPDPSCTFGEVDVFV